MVIEENPKILYSSKSVEYKFLSNFYICDIHIDGIRYNHVEGYYQSQKFAGVHKTAFKHISNIYAPSIARNAARKYIMDNKRQEEWEEGLGIAVMMKGMMAKFIGNSELQDKLLATGDSILIENAPWDDYWGSGKDGNGKNMSGRILMEVRNAIRTILSFNS